MQSFFYSQSISRDSCAVSQLEKVLTLMATLPEDSDFGAKLHKLVIDIRERIPPDHGLFFVFIVDSFSVQGPTAPSLFIPCASAAEPSYRRCIPYTTSP